MGRVLINDDEAFEILDYLIKKDNSYEEYLAQKLFISMELYLHKSKSNGTQSRELG